MVLLTSISASTSAGLTGLLGVQPDRRHGMVLRAVHVPGLSINYRRVAGGWLTRLLRHAVKLNDRKAGWPAEPQVDHDGRQSIAAAPDLIRYRSHHLTVTEVTATVIVPH